MNYLKLLEAKDIEVFIRRNELFKSCDYIDIDLRINDSNDELDCMIIGSNNMFLELTFTNYSIKGIDSEELNIVWQGYMYRLFGQDYLNTFIDHEIRRYCQGRIMVNSPLTISLDDLLTSYVREEKRRISSLIDREIKALIDASLKYWYYIEPKEIKRNRKKES